MIPGARTFMVSLPRLHVKRDVTLALMEKQGITAEIFNAIDNDITGYATQHVYELDNPGSKWNMGPKLVNLLLAHVLLWKACLYMENDAFVVLEDDVRFSDDWKVHIDDALNHMGNAWDILYIGSCCVEHHHARRVVHNRLNKVAYALCTHAYAVRKKALPKLIDNICSHIFAPVDIGMILQVPQPFSRFAIWPRIATQIDMELQP